MKVSTWVRSGRRLGVVRRVVGTEAGQQEAHQTLVHGTGTDKHSQYTSSSSTTVLSIHNDMQPNATPNTLFISSIKAK